MQLEIHVDGLTSDVLTINTFKLNINYTQEELLATVQTYPQIVEALINIAQQEVPNVRVGTH